MPTNPKTERNLRRPPTSAPLVTALVSLATTLIFAFSRLAGAKTVNANSASQSDVAAAIASAADGDTVTIPGGTASWTRTLRVKRGITIQGAGVGVTIIKDNVQSGQLIQWTLAAGLTSRLTGIEFQNGGRTSSRAGAKGVVEVRGTNTDGSQFRFDHNAWTNLNGELWFDTVIGVVDHNTVTVGTPFNGWLEFWGGYWNGDTGHFGDNSWAAPANFGSSQFLFIEDNTVTSTIHPPVGGQLGGFCDAEAGARFVIRHNTMAGVIPNNHGTESSGRWRSARAMEIYNNSMDGYGANKFVTANRGGTELFHDNTLTNFWGAAAIHNLASLRMIGTFPIFLGADGSNAWDVNNAGNPFYTGTITTVTPPLNISVTGNPWTAHQWIGYTIVDQTVFNSCGQTCTYFAYITDNTSNTITFDFGKPLTMVPAVGDSFKIVKVEQSIDQPGVGQSTLISGFNVTPPPNWSQVAEPCYIWNNTNDGPPGVNIFTPNTSNIKVNVNYFNNTPMPGYTPYTYPHPLTKGLPSPGQMTRNATENSQHNLQKKRQPWGGKKLDRKKAKKAKESPTKKMADGQDNLGK